MILNFILLLSLDAHGQQNLFNIPSGDVTPRSHLFYQHQINMYDSESLKSKQHFVYGVGRGIDLGLNVLDVGLERGDGVQGQEVLLAFSAQKSWRTSIRSKVNLSLQSGGRRHPTKQGPLPSSLAALLYNYSLAPHSKLVIGPYWSPNSHFLGGSAGFGLQLGYEIFLTKSFGLMGDLITGDSEASAGVIGFVVNLNKNLQVCLGQQLPVPGSLAQEAFVLEVNAFTFDLI